MATSSAPIPALINERRQVAMSKLVLILIILGGCAQIESYRTFDQPTGEQLSAPIGGVMLKIRKTRDLPNVFGRADIWGGKVDEGFTELRYLGMSEDGTISLRLVDQDIVSDENVFTRYMGKGSPNKALLSPAATEFKHNFREKPEIAIFNATITILDATPVNIRYILIKDAPPTEMREIKAQNVEPRIGAVTLEAEFQSLTEQLSVGLKRHGITRVAVLPVEDSSNIAGKALGRYLTEKITTRLHGTGQVQIVERSKLGQVVDELALTQTGRFDEASAKRIGNLLGVDAVIVGTYTELGVHTIEVNSRIVKVETGEVLGAGTIQIPRSVVQQLLR